jgi:hypothetical protein
MTTLITATLSILLIYVGACVVIGFLGYLFNRKR